MSNLAWLGTVALGTVAGYALASVRLSFWKRRADYWMAEAVTARGHLARWSRASTAGLHPHGALGTVWARWSTVDELMPHVVEVPE